MAVYFEDRCCAHPDTGLIGCRDERDLQEETYDFAVAFSVLDRNIIRKISKQYRIIAIEQEEDLYFDDGHRRRIIQSKPWIIKYQNWETNDPRFRPFEWEFNDNNF